MPATNQMPDIKKINVSDKKIPQFTFNDLKLPAKDNMPASEQKRPPLYINDTKIPTKDKMTASDHKRPTLSVNDTNMPDDEHMPAENQKSRKFTSYNTVEEFLAYYNFRNYVEEHHALHFYSKTGNPKLKYEFRIKLLQK